MTRVSTWSLAAAIPPFPYRTSPKRHWSRRSH